MMTWVEVKDAIDHGKTTALIYNGGTETRGPQAVNGGHTLVAHAKVIEIAKELGNAIAAPVLPSSPNNASPDLPGTIGITNDTFKEVNKEVAEQLIRNGFKNVVIMGDHGGGQKQLGEVATELDAKYLLRASGWSIVTTPMKNRTRTTMHGSPRMDIPRAGTLRSMTHPR